MARMYDMGDIVIGINGFTIWIYKVNGRISVLNFIRQGMFEV